MSYHNGSVWPHDNSLILAGLKRYGMDAEALHVAEEVFDAAVRFPLYRLPELYCGFARDRRYSSMPAQYPVSCSPQAWAAGSVFLIVQTHARLARRRAQQSYRAPPDAAARDQQVRILQHAGGVASARPRRDPGRGNRCAWT